MSNMNDDDKWFEVERPKLTFRYMAFMALQYFFEFKPTYVASSKSDNSQCTSIQLPNLGNSSLERFDDTSIKPTPISCSVEKECETTYRIYLSIGETSYILTTGRKINADFIMKMAVKFGYFQIRLCDLRNIVRSVFSGTSAETRAIVRYIKPYLINKREYYDGLKEFKEEDVNFDECDSEEE